MRLGRGRVREQPVHKRRDLHGLNVRRKHERECVLVLVLAWVRRTVVRATHQPLRAQPSQLQLERDLQLHEAREI